MIVKSDKIPLLKSLDGYPMFVFSDLKYTDHTVTETLKIVVEVTISDRHKCQIGFDYDTVGPYHCSSKLVACICAFKTLIQLVKNLDPDAIITCGGVNCSGPETAWSKSLETILPCLGTKASKEKGHFATWKPINTGNKEPKAPKAPKALYKEKSLIEFPGEYEPVIGTLESIPSYTNEHARSVYGAIFCFYALEEASLADIKPNCFEERYKEFIDTTARTMFDYLAMISLTEARHAAGVSWNIYKDEGSSHSRSAAWKYGIKYNPRQFLKVCEFVFKNCPFSSNYGGKPWAIIASSALKYFELPVKAWLDHVVDLSHHGGLAFNKGIFWIPPDNSNAYLEMLSRKKNGSVFDKTKSQEQFLQTSHAEMKWLMYCAGLVDEPGPKCPPLKWGTKLVVAHGGVEDWTEEVGNDSQEERNKSFLNPERII